MQLKKLDLLINKLCPMRLYQKIEIYEIIRHNKNTYLNKKIIVPHQRISDESFQ